MKLGLGVLVTGIVMGIVWTIIVIVNSINFDIDCEGHLKRAADANSIELAQQELGIALTYMEDHKMTKGNTGVLWVKPKHEIDFWYNNIKSSYDELGTLTDETTGLEKSNMLIKLRETLIDHDGQSGDSVTMPPRIANYPNHVTLWMMCWTSIILIACGGTIITIKG